MNATAQIANVANDELVQIQVQLNGSTASIVSEVRSAGKVLLCHRTESGTYQSIDVSVNAEPAHRAPASAENWRGRSWRPDQGLRSELPADRGVRQRSGIVRHGQDANATRLGPSIKRRQAVTWTRSGSPTLRAT